MLKLELGDTARFPCQVKYCAEMILKGKIHRRKNLLFVNILHKCVTVENELNIVKVFKMPQKMLRDAFQKKMPRR